MSKGVLGRDNAMGDVRDSFRRLWTLISDVAWNRHEEDALYSNELRQWNIIAKVSPEYQWKMQSINSLILEWRGRNSQ